LKILTFTTLYPNSINPQHGVFVENRLQQIVRLGSVKARVVAPVPWFPFAGRMWGSYGDFARIPALETREGVRVVHPRYPVIPKIGMGVAPDLLRLGAASAVRRESAGMGGARLIDAHYFYPDGVAAVQIGARLNLPVVISARGSDINLLPSFDGPRRAILKAADGAARIIAVSAALRDAMVDLGIAAGKIEILRNGVDLDRFRPLDRDRTRRELGLADGPTLIAVGNVLASKGQDIAIRALKLLPDTSLLVVGSGPDEDAFRRLADAEGVRDRVRFVGRVPQDDLARYFSAADISVLASVREGWPNVLLESLACGTPAIATNVGGVPEILRTPDTGEIMKERTPEALADAVRDVRNRRIERAKAREYATSFGWTEIARAQLRLYEDVATEHARH
jgi:teichuronic acid biosynthesis glycosyltransferase TuaC